MIENATNLTNTTTCLGVWRGFWKFLSDYWQELSALAAIITIILVVIGLFFRIYLQKKQHVHEAKMLRLKQEYPKHEAKRILKRQLEEFISCWEDGKKDYQKQILKEIEFQADILAVGKMLKKHICNDKMLLPQTIIVDANGIVDDIVELAKRMRPRLILTEPRNEKIVDDGNLLVEKARELIEKLDGKNE